MRLLLVPVCLLVAAPSLSAQTLRDARAALQKGNYAEAQESYEDLRKDAKLANSATLGLSRALESEGKYDEALKVVEEQLKKSPKDADLLGRHAEILYARGRWDEATTSARAALAIQDDHLPARWVIAQVIRDRGDWPKADEEFRWFVRYYSKRSDDDKEITDAESLRIIGLAGLERARYHHIGDQYEFVVNEVLVDAAKNDKLYWQASYEAGRVYLDKHNKAAAARAFDKALTINPRATDVFAAKGLAAFSQFEIKEAELYADQALAINPNHIEALRVKAAVHLFSNETDAALKLLSQARGVNPRHEPTLAQIAACLYVQKKQKDFDALVKEVAAFNPKAWLFHVELAAQLDSRKLFFDAEGFYKTAIKLEPNMPEGHDGLGMLYMRLGKEKEARRLMTDAFDADPFNVRVSNTLKVLDHLERYETAKIPNYILRFDPKHDDILARFVLHYLEGLDAELSKKFDYKPKEPFLIEIFNKHEMFSGRVTALPDLHTIGACTGRMMAMVTTHDRSKVINKPFNWVRVLRHEVVHLYNLDQTKFQVPHWVTEGLAVTMEGKTTPPKWNYLLAEKLRENDLLNLDNILLGFVRPRSPDQWQQAYLQSQLYIEYLVKTHGEPSVGKLLAAYAEGLETEAAFEKTIGIKKAEFEKGYRAFLEERVKDLKLPPVPKVRSLKDLKEARKQQPENPDVLAELAERHYLNGDGPQALALADEALRLKANHPLAAYVKAAALVAEKQPKLALSVLTTAVDENPNEIKALRLLGRLQFETMSFDLAAATYEKGRKLEPFEPSWLVQLAKCYVQTKQEDRLMGILGSVAESDPDDLLSRSKLAAYHHKRGEHALAERYAWEVMEIDVKHAESQTILLESLKAQNKDEKLKLVTKLLNGE